MKNIILLSLFVMASFGLFAKSVQADFQYVTFWSPETGPYVEVYISVVGSSVDYLPVGDGEYQGAVNYTVMFKQGETVVDFTKQEIKSPLVSDTTTIGFNFIDIKRFQLPNGDYEICFFVEDASKDVPPLEGEDSFSITYTSTDVAISGIELIQKYSKTEETTILSKYGFDIIPKIFAFYPEEEKKLSFYTEIYNVNKRDEASDAYLLRYYIQNYESHQQVDEYIYQERGKSQQVDVLLRSIDISNLPSGNYQLVVEARDRKNELIGINSIFFMRSNPSIEFSSESLAEVQVESSFVSKIYGRDSLEYCIKCLRPIAGNLDRSFIDNQVAQQSDDVLRKFIFNFWMKQDENYPEEAWKLYENAVRAVNEEYGTTTHYGFDTDRGRVLLQYGAPNTIVDRSFDASAAPGSEGVVPYQIWHYYQLNEQRDRKFVFYNPRLVGEDYELIHSTAQGESYNPQWQTMLRRGTFENAETGVNGFDGQSGEYYYNPY